MNWEAVGAVGEIIGAAAVVLSLGYLAIQIRQNSGVSRSVAIQHWASTSALEKSVVFSDPEFAALIQRGFSNYIDLDPIEQIRFRTYFVQTINSFELLYFQLQNNTIDATFFKGKEQSYLKLFARKGIIQLWSEIAETQWDERFISYVEQNKPEPADA